MSLSALPMSPEQLHPSLWRAHQLGHGRAGTQASGYPMLDAELPGGGWPQRAVTELLLSEAGCGEIRLLAPLLARVGAMGRGVLMLGPPAEPCAEALAHLGVDLSRCVVIRGADLLWPLEQALRSGQVGAIVAWVPATLKGEALRRLQLASQSHEGAAFIVRDRAAAMHPSPAPLRLALAAGGPDALAVRLLKRRGPTRDEPVLLALPPVLSRIAWARASMPRRAGMPAPSTAG
ncbi:MAG: translesion DNA synthesis-associated protein ImuA [Burkholderiaceae bacterium]